MPAERIGIWGVGREGIAAARFLRAERPSAEMTLLNDGPVADVPDALRDVPLLIGEQAVRAIASGGFSLIVKSPGISPLKPEMGEAEAKGTAFTSGTNLWFERFSPENTLAVTGTKGKSTTSSLIHHIALAAGKRSRILGNVGVPALTEPPGEDLTVLELSSYQTADLVHAPDMAVFTNLFAEHVPWHGSLERYYADKLRLAGLDAGTTVIANRANAELAARLSGRPHVIWYNDAAGYEARADGLFYRGAPVAVTGNVPRGQHNLSNLAGAATAALEAGALSDPRSIDVGGFSLLPHRLQEFMTADGILAVDDSISTIPEATLAAVAAYQGRPIHLIMGGTDRAQDYEALAGTLAGSSVVSVHCLPDTGARIAEALFRHAPKIATAESADLGQAVAEIRSKARPGDVILLSPAAPSFVAYRNFEERGDAFQGFCRQSDG